MLDSCRDLLEKLDDTATLDEKIEECIRECEVIAELNRKLLEENTKVAMDNDEFMKRYDSYVKRYEEETQKLEKLKHTLEEQREKADKVSGFMFEIHEQDGLLQEFDVKLWLTTIDKVLISHDGRMTFIFNNGSEVIR